MPDILQTTFANAFWRRKLFEFGYKFQSSLILRVQLKLEQLERLCSEDTPRRLMITHTIEESYWIPSQKMTKSKLQILKIRQNFKF